MYIEECKLKMTEDNDQMSELKILSGKLREDFSSYKYKMLMCMVRTVLCYCPKDDVKFVLEMIMDFTSEFDINLGDIEYKISAAEECKISTIDESLDKGLRKALSLCNPNGDKLSVKDLIAKNIKRLRLKKGWTRKQVGKKLNRAASTIGDYENGRVSFSEEMIKSLCKTFNVDLKELLMDGGICQI